MNLRTSAPYSGKIRILRRAIAKGKLGALAAVLKNKTYMNETCYELRRDLNTPFRVRRAKIPVTVRELRREDIPLIFDGRDANLSPEGFLWREHRLRLLANDIQTCYVAVTEVGRPCHVQWVFQPWQNGRRREVFGNEFPDLQEDEAIFEYAFTLEPYRGLNIGPWAGEKILEIEKCKSIRWVITFVSMTNIRALKMAKVGGCLPIMVRKEQWRLFNKTFSFAPLPKGPHFPFKEEGERRSERSLPSDLEGENFGDKEAARLPSALPAASGKRSRAIALYYLLKPLVPRRLQIALRRRMAIRRRTLCAGVWPIDAGAGKAPEGWGGWPEGKRFALVLTHDVDTAWGQRQCERLMRLEQRQGLRSSFNFVARRYEVSPAIRQTLTRNGFEVGVHGLYHDGKLYASRKGFLERAVHINRTLQEWGCAGFRSPAMQHNLEWIHDLDIEYDASTFDTDPFEPQPDGMGTIFPFWVARDSGTRGYVELPYTLAQDFTLFVLLGEKGIHLWREKLDWIAERGGMALVNTHPDYMNFDDRRPGAEEYPAEYYEEFLAYVRNRYGGRYWHPLPIDMARFWTRNFVTSGRK